MTATPPRASSRTSIRSLTPTRSLSRDDFFPNILQAIEQDGKLCATCSSFSLSTVMGASSIVGDTPGWTYDQLWEAYANMPEDCQIFEYYYTRYDALRQGLSLDIDSFCDWSTGTCSFDSDSFKDLLKFAAFFPKEFDWNNFEYGKDVEPYTLVSQGREMLMNVYLYNLNDAGMYDAMFGELGATYIGFPSDNGTGNMISANSGFAMSTTCADKEGAWQFLRTFFTEKYQTENQLRYPHQSQGLQNDGKGGHDSPVQNDHRERRERSGHHQVRA